MRSTAAGSDKTWKVLGPEEANEITRVHVPAVHINDSIAMEVLGTRIHHARIVYNTIKWLRARTTGDDALFSV